MKEILCVVDGAYFDAEWLVSSAIRTRAARLTRLETVYCLDVLPLRQLSTALSRRRPTVDCTRPRRPIAFLQLYVAQHHFATDTCVELSGDDSEKVETRKKYFLTKFDNIKKTKKFNFMNSVGAT